MSQFEYLRNLSIGQYLPLDSILHRLDPRAKLLALSLLILVVSLAHKLGGLAIGLIIALALMVAGSIPLGYALRAWLAALPYLLALAVLQLLMVRPALSQLPLINLWRLPIYGEGLISAGRLLLRFSVLMELLTVASATLSSLETIYALDILLKPLHWLGMNPTPLVMVVQIMLRFLPNLALSAEKIAKSQASRGADWDSRRGGLVARARRILPLILPLFLISLKQAETMADAMLARGFSEKKERTSLRVYQLHGVDVCIMLGAASAALMILYPPWAG